MSLQIVVAQFHLEQSWDDSVDVGLPWFYEFEDERGKGIVVTNTRDNFGTPIEGLLAARESVTPRSRRRSRTGGRRPVFAYVPTEDALELAQRLALGGLVVIAGGDEWVIGWSRFVSAIDAGTGERIVPFSDPQTKLLEHLKVVGNNGWPVSDLYVKRTVPRTLNDLLGSGLTGEEICGAMLAAKAGYRGVKNLRRWLERV